MHCKFPYQYGDTITIKEIICSFLNAEGGILFIGIKKEKNGKRIVEGSEYTESEKENILRTFRQIAQTIEPDIITHKMYGV